MQTLNKNDYIRIQKTINAYHRLGITWESKIEEKLGKAWGDIFEQFKNCCQGNQEWIELYNYIRDYKEVTKFDMDSNFEITLGDSEFKFKVYNETIHREYVDAYNHLDNYKKNINGKIGKLDHKRFAIGKKIRIDYLKNKLRSIENEANLYAYWKQKDALKNDYLENRTETYKEKKTQFNQIENIIASELVFDALKHRSILAYRDMDLQLSSNFKINGLTYEVNNKALTRMLNNLRHQILDPKEFGNDNTLSK